jgi:hypothetical protein
MRAERTQSDRTKPNSAAVVPAERAGARAGTQYSVSSRGHGLLGPRFRGDDERRMRGQQRRDLAKRTKANVSPVGFVFPSWVCFAENKANL